MVEVAGMALNVMPFYALFRDVLEDKFVRK